MKHIIIIGAGIVGLATAKHLAERTTSKITVVDTEKEIALHQTGHNSGVIHSGLYYKPGSLKAENCVQGRKMLIDYCDQKSIPYELCGKVVVACNQKEEASLDTLIERSHLNGLTPCRTLLPQDIKEIEPHCSGTKGLYVPDTGIVDYKLVAEHYKQDIIQNGGEIKLNFQVAGIQQNNSFRLISTKGDILESSYIINCAGLYSDRVARMCNLNPGVQIVPFRGEYYKLTDSKKHLVNHLIYPVPNPEFPFLGVHFTRDTHGDIEAGPNAVLAFKRTGYKFKDISIPDLLETLTYSGFWKMVSKYWDTGLYEMKRSLSKRAFTEALQKLIPELKEEDIVSAGAGVRAQALDPHGKLIDDFKIIQSNNMIHVLNAPSPAATSSLSIGQKILQLANSQFNLSSIK